MDEIELRTHGTVHTQERAGMARLLCVLIIAAALCISITMADNTTAPAPVNTTIPATTAALQSTTILTTSPTTVATTVVPTTIAVKKPKIEFSATPTDGAAPLKITVYPVFNPAGGAPDYIIIDFGDGQQVNDTLKTSYDHTYAIAGVYTVSLTSVNSGGSNVETMTNLVSVRIPATIGGTAVNTSPTQIVNTTPTGTVTPTPTPTPVLNTTSVNTTALTAVVNASDPCSDANVTLADFIATPVQGPAPLKVSFSDNSSCAPPVAWQWDFGSPVNPGIKMMRDPTVTYTEPGTYNVTLTVINALNRNSTKTKTAFIRVLPPVTPTPFPTTAPTPVPVPVTIPNFTANQTTGPALLCVQFNDASTGAAAATWFWDFGDGTNATTKNPVHCYTKSGNFTVSLKTAPSGGAPATKARENYIIVTSEMPGIPIDMVIIGILIVIIIVVAAFVLYRRGQRPHHSHSGGHHEEHPTEEHEGGGEGKGSHRRGDL